MSDSKFPSLRNRRNTAVMDLVFQPLAGEGRGNLLTFPLILSPIPQGDHRDFMIITLLAI